MGIAAAIALFPISPYLAGFISGVITGGDLKSGIIGALTAGAFNHIGGLVKQGVLSSTQALAAKGLVGGVSSVAQGGKFGAGFLSGAVGGPSGSYGQGIGGVIAGTIAAAVPSVLAPLLYPAAKDWQD